MYVEPYVLLNSSHKMPILGLGTWRVGDVRSNVALLFLIKTLTAINHKCHRLNIVKELLILLFVTHVKAINVTIRCHVLYLPNFQ